MSNTVNATKWVSEVSKERLPPNSLSYLMHSFQTYSPHFVSFIVETLNYKKCVYVHLLRKSSPGAGPKLIRGVSQMQNCSTRSVHLVVTEEADAESP